MRLYIQQLITLFSIMALATTLISCGGGGSGGESTDANQPQGKGTVGILLTDKPADPDDFTSMIASIVKVELMGSEDNGRVTIYSGPAKEYDLLRLRNESIPLAFKDKVPAGTYCKIRLTLSDLELTLTADNSTYHPKLPGNGKLDLVVRGCFKVVGGEVLTLQLDVDAGKSIHVIGNSKGYNFRPVIFVDVMTRNFDSKLVRLTGKIFAVDQDKQSLLLCDALPNKSMDNLGCVNVHFGKNSAFFDIKYQGTPSAINDLLSKANQGMELTVVGWLKPWNGNDYDDDQPVQHQPLLHMEALVAELGDFLTIEGTVAVDADKDGFDMQVSTGAPVIGTLDVMYQPRLYPDQTGINGTRIISKSGVLLLPQDAQVPLPTQVDGVIDLNTKTLKAALVILDQDGPGIVQVTGTILSLGADYLILDPDEGIDIICGIATTQLTVDLIDPLAIMTITVTEDMAEIEPGGTLMAGQTVGMNGTCEVGGYQTDNVIVVDD